MRDEAPAPQPGGLDRLLRWAAPLPPEESPARWHVSPLIDILAYHFSWLPMIVLLLPRGDAHPADYRFLFLLAVAGNFAHQALSLPLVYLDKEVLARERRRATAVPITLLLLFVISVVWWRAEAPTFASFRSFIVPIAVVAYTWNFWHVYMQKYGILRVYAAKARGGAMRPVPGWVDRLLVFGGLPLAIAVIGPRSKDFLLQSYPVLGSTLRLGLDAVVALQPVLVLLGGAVFAASVAVFLWHEKAAHGLSCAPRLWAGAGMVLLGLSLVVLNPIKAIIAFGFSHVVEYCVFAWAYQRRRHAVRRSESPLLSRLLRRPGLAVLSFVLIVGTLFFVVDGWPHYAPERPVPAAWGMPLVVVTALLALFMSMAHFWFDGFLWKVRRKEVMDNL